MATCPIGMVTVTAKFRVKHHVQRNAGTILLDAGSSSISVPSFHMASVRGLSMKFGGRPASPTSHIYTTAWIGGVNSFKFTSPQVKGGARGSGKSLVPRASKEASSLDSEKPMWWWRTAACLPYFLPFHETWNYGETAYFLQPYLERFEFLTNPVLYVPSWFSMLYFFVAYLWLIRQRDLPHFVRFHIMMGMLLENILQIIWTVSRWMPLTYFGVKVGVYFWTAVSVGLFLCLLECMRCALAGKYAAIPYISDAANMQIPCG